MSALELRRVLKLSPKQARLLQFRAPLKADGSVQIEIVGCLGEYGGGKSFIAALRALSVALENPFVDGEYMGGEDVPLSGFVAPTASDMKKSTLVQFMKVCPEELIYRMRLYGEYQDIQLINGHRILLYSAEGALNGPTLCQLWADEIQESCYEGKWINLQGRVREKRGRRLNVQASGIAERGHVEEIFRRPNSENRRVELLFPEENAGNLARGYVDELQASLPASRERDSDGWLLPQGAMFPKFSRVRHVRMPPGMEGVELDELRGRPTSIAVDFGRRAAVLAAQPTPRLPVRPITVDGKPREGDGRGLLLVDQLMPDDVDAEEMVALIRRELQWKIVPGRSVICLDPTAEPDQVRHFKRGFPGVEVWQVQRGFYHLEANGIRAVDRALLDLHQDVRLYVHPTLARHDSGRGVVEMFSGHLAAKPKDKKLEHACDVVRYLVARFVPLPNPPKSDDPALERELERMGRPLTAGLEERNL